MNLQTPRYEQAIKYPIFPYQPADFATPCLAYLDVFTWLGLGGLGRTDSTRQGVNETTR